MFCPSCGTEERQTSQFCRACGIDMRTVRTALQKPDSITASASSARDEIGRAIAAKIHELQSANDLKKVAEDVLPQIEKFLESPEQRRLRRLRAGVMTAAVGLGAMITLLLGYAPIPPLVFIGWPGGLLVFFIGLGLVINGLVFTVPAKQISDNSLERKNQFELEQTFNSMPATIATPNIVASLPEAPVQDAYLKPPPSVTEHTTRQLPHQVAVPKKRITSEINN